MQFSKITSILVGLSLALSVGASVQAQFGSSDDLVSYQRLLQMRIERGKSSGQLTGQEYKRLQGMLQNIQNFNGQFQRGRYSQSGHQQVLALMTQLDQDIWNDLHDDDMSHWRNWDDKKKSWKSTNYWNKDWNNSGWNWNKGNTLGGGNQAGWNGGNQPGWNGGNKPGWNGGNQQPGWNGGNQRPGWNGGNQQPGWNNNNNSKNWNKGNNDWNDKDDKKQWKKWNRANNGQQQPGGRAPNWMISKDGGYFDGTGQIKFLVPGNELYKYGGTLQDGRPVPNTPNVQMNASGHIF